MYQWNLIKLLEDKLSMVILTNYFRKSWNMESFLQKDVYNYGDFCWVDFQCENDLEKVSNEEFAELLYLSHRIEPLKDFRN